MASHQLTAALLAGCALWLLAGQANAQAGPDTEPGTDLDEVVVTGQRQAYRGDFSLRDTPQSITVLDAEILQDAGVTRLADALDLSASIARQNNFGGLWDSFAVRGFVGDENLPSSYLVNGFNAGRGFGGPRDISGVDRVEILKGPRAALFGRGEPGGTINLVTKRPTFETAGEVRLKVGSFETWRADADWTGPLNDAVAVRLVGFYEDAGSFRDTVETLKYGFSPSITWRISPATEVSYEIEYRRQELPLDRGVLALNGRLGVIPTSRFLGEPGEKPNVLDVAGHQLELHHDLNDAWSVLAGINYRETSLEGFSTDAELAVSRQPLFVDGRSLARERRFRDYDAAYQVLRAELSGSFLAGGLRHRVLLGIDRDEFENDQIILRYRPPVLSSNPTAQQSNLIDIFNPLYGRFPLPTPSSLASRVETQGATGVYFQDQVALNDRLEIRVGARYDRYDQAFDNRTTSTLTTQDEERLSPQVGVVFDAARNVTIYAAYGENFRPLSGSDFAGRAFEPNVSRSLEAGVKFTLAEERLNGTVSVFSLSQDNILTADPLNAGFSIAAGEAESQGLELDLQGEVAEGVNVWLSYAWVDAAMKNDVLDRSFGLAIRAGDRLINVPEHTASLMASKDFLLHGRTARAGIGVLFVGERLGEVATTFELPGYTTVRLFGSYAVTDRVDLAFEVNNLADEAYYTNSYSALWVAPGAPRNASVTLRYRY
ncbi:TonB-dependent siderophore receptor [Brevundimonas sp.]|uniref:TonB-dependent siderophore receptor n=1 Tax=Brevundimonas sp. TaxID=1871086 RepID=UPI002D699548|nr:TonB-dependent siderophore receptor [Brevundimonas sp.]HYC99380.1 TonB-dependent siderophore receptor [Brevundimonas sp.]